MQSPLIIDLKYFDNISITEEYQLLNYSVIIISNIMKMNIFKIDLNFKQGSITDVTVRRPVPVPFPVL